MDVARIRVVLVAGEGEDDFLGDFRLHLLPAFALAVNVFYRLQGAGNGAGAAPGFDEHRPRLVVQNDLLDELRPRRVFRKVAVKLHIANTYLRLQVFGRGVSGVVHLQAIVHLGVSLHHIVDEALVGRPTPTLHGRQFKSVAPRVFAPGHPPLGAVPVALPVELAAGINQSLHPVVRAEQQEADKRIVVVQLGVARDDDARLRSVFTRRLGLEAGRHGRHQAGKK